MALSDDGATLLATVRSGRGEVVYSYQGSQAAQVFYSARRISGLAFMPGSSAAIVAEPNAVKVVTPEFGAQAIGGPDLADVVAVAASADRSRRVHRDAFRPDRHPRAGVVERDVVGVRLRASGAHSTPRKCGVPTQRNGQWPALAAGRGLSAAANLVRSRAGGG